MNKLTNAIKALALLALAIVAIWVTVTQIRSCTPRIVDEPDKPVVVVPRRPILPRGSVVVSRPDSTGGVSMERVRVPDASSVDEVITVDSTTIAILKPKDRFFPDFGRRETRVRILDGDRERIYTTVQPSPLLDVYFKGTFGATMTDFRNIGPTFGVEVVRIWAIRVGASVTYLPQNKQLVFGPEAGLRLRQNLSVMAGADISTQKPFFGIRYVF